MRLKNIHYALLLGAGIAMSGCSDYLDTSSPSIPSNESVFTSEALTKNAVMGVYSALIADNLYKGRIPCNWQGVTDIELGRNENNSDEDGYPNYWGSIYQDRCRWTDGYKLAELATAAVDGIRQSPLMESNPTLMKSYLGEMLTLRALAYFELVRLWGDVPYKEETSKSDLSNVYIGKTSRDTIYNAIIGNLQEAIGYLPWMGEGEYTAERVTKGFAYGLLARVALAAGGYSLRDANQLSDEGIEHLGRIQEMSGYYVGRPKDWQKYYEIAENACAELIGNSENPHGLDPDYGNIWKTVCRLELNKYNENLFEVAMGMAQNGDIGNLIGYSIDGENKHTKGGRSMGGTYSTSNAYYFYSFDPDDKRRDYSVYWTSYKHDSATDTDGEKMGNNPINVQFNKWNYFWTTDEWKALLKEATARIGNGINWIIMRYSDVLLMYAEAANALHDPNYVNPTAGISPREALQTVRERAFGTGSPEATVTASGQDEFFDAIVNERAWEFGGEAVRKGDLIRWGLLDQKIQEMQEAICCMMDGGTEVKCFDKTYAAGELPTKLYYRYMEDGETGIVNGDEDATEFIDIASINFYKQYEETQTPSGNQWMSTNWLSGNVRPDANNPESTKHLDNFVKILKMGSGLMATYDYEALYNKLTTYGSALRTRMATERIGNGVCNFRCLFPIYSEDVYETKGTVSNSYGY